MWRGLLDLLFPRACCACGARPCEGAFCRSCAPLLEVAPPWRCRICAGAAPPPREPEASERERALSRAARAEGIGPASAGAISSQPLGPRRAGELPLCPLCRAHPPPFDEIAAPFLYGGPVGEAIHRLKYRGRREVAGSLGALVADSCRRLAASVDVIAPIALHPSRRRERGYDQALLLARAVARGAGRPCGEALIRRIRDTPRQVGRDRPERESNLEGAFEAGARIRGLRVALVDDVVTTGATARAAAAAAREAGAAGVVVLAVARAV